MKIMKWIIMSAFVLAAMGSASVSQAQETRNTESTHNTFQRRGRGDRSGFLRSLGLSVEQMEQIRQINTERRPLMIDAQKRFREVMRALDAAIYADVVIEADVEARLKDVQSAQAEVSRIRFENELAVRRVLTAEQLSRFRELRRKFEQMRKDRRERREPDDTSLPRRHRREAGVSPQATRPVQTAPPLF
jgi:Spy/CpxP family protein refolding chaperone